MECGRRRSGPVCEWIPNLALSSVVMNPSVATHYMTVEESWHRPLRSRVVGAAAVVIIAIILTTAACGSPTTDKSTRPTTNPVGSWELTWWDDPTSLADFQITLKVSSDAVTGFSSCRGYTGLLTMDGKAFHVGGVGTILTICDSVTDPIERTYFSLLQSVDFWNIDGTDLVLSTDGSPTLRYRRM